MKSGECCAIPRFRYVAPRLLAGAARAGFGLIPPKGKAKEKESKEKGSRGQSPFLILFMIYGCSISWIKMDRNELAISLISLAHPPWGSRAPAPVLL
jgi:hypothetical protein